MGDRRDSHRLVIGMTKAKYDRLTKHLKKTGITKKFLINKLIEDYIRASEENKETA